MKRITLSILAMQVLMVFTFFGFFKKKNRAKKSVPVSTQNCYELSKKCTKKQP